MFNEHLIRKTLYSKYNNSVSEICIHFPQKKKERFAAPAFRGINTMRAKNEFSVDRPVKQILYYISSKPRNSLIRSRYTLLFDLSLKIFMKKKKKKLATLCVLSTSSVIVVIILPNDLFNYYAWFWSIFFIWWSMLYFSLQNFYYVHDTF